MNIDIELDIMGCLIMTIIAVLSFLFACTMTGIAKWGLVIFTSVALVMIIVFAVVNIRMSLENEKV